MVYDFLTEREGQELYETIQGYINEVREKGANYVIILAHLGNEGDASEKYTSNGLLAHINGVDAVLDGHSHRNYSVTSKDKDGKDVYVVQTGTKFNYLGTIKISTDGSITSKLLSEVPEPEDKEGATKITRDNKERWIDVNMGKVIEEKIKSHSEQLNEVIGYTDFDLIINMDKSSDSSKQISRSEENTLCDLVADSIRDIGKGDICMINAGTIRADLFKGNITYKNLLDVLPFSTDIVIKKVLGEDILDALEYGMRFLPEKSSIFPQVSGISFKVNTGIKSSVEVDDLEMFVRVAGERRVSDVYVGEEKLDLKKNYTLSFDKYISDGGDGFSMFTKYEEISVTSKVDNEAFKIYIKDVLNGKIPDIYKHKQGRINIIKLEPEVEIEGNGSSALTIILILLLCLIVIGVIAFIIYRRKKTKETNDINLYENINV
jgi:2',3'-cyclic-nucleotide 2'-phosphodiesterase (5'-nucleotidase family)